jgi:hypothetical protein
MDEGVELRCFGMRRENGKFLDLTYWKKQRSKFVWLRKTFMSCNRDKRATPTIEGESKALTWEISFTSRCHLGEVCIILRFEANSALDSLDRLRILEKRGAVAYQLELPPQLSDVHDLFHVSQLKKCLRLPEEQIPMEDLDAKEDLSYQEYPVRILETSERVMQNKKIKMCKV